MTCDVRLFAPQIAAFSQDRKVIVPDVWGAEAMADLAAQVLEQAPDRFALAGLSMSGIVAMEVVRQSPDRVLGLGLLDTNPLPSASGLRRLNRYKDLLQLLRSVDTPTVCNVIKLVAGRQRWDVVQPSVNQGHPRIC